MLGKALGATDISTIHQKCPLVLSFPDPHVALGPARQTKVGNHPLLIGILVFRSQKLEEHVNAACFNPYPR